MKVDRPGAAIIGAVLMFTFRIVQPGHASRSIDYATLVLLFSMMLIVANLHLVGFFDAVAEVAIERLGTRHLLPAVIFTSGVLSAFFVNDITTATSHRHHGQPDSTGHVQDCICVLAS
jgi:Na+/H+ antiporter NhaD/arsenite permease-like protein